ncbi:MAG: cofactor-independent phosphoglycerate mutase [Clostridium sp.]
MKYIIVLGDGMADEPIEALGGKTPIEYADTSTLDHIAPISEIGLAATIPYHMPPGSDTANLAVLGYDPKKYYTGRSPLEALSIGVDMAMTDVALRCNIVTLSEDDLPYEEKTILDHSSGSISTEDAAILIDAVKTAFEDETYHFYVGVSYRHLLIWEHGSVVDLTAPHDVLGHVIGEFLPTDAILRDMMKRSYDILNNHPINIQRAKEGKNKANSLWFWGAGTRPALSSFYEKTGKKGVMISAVDLLKGIAIGAGMRSIDVPGANGELDTNYEGKAEAALRALLEEDADFVYIHVEAPDEMGHQGSVEKKVKAIEYLDQRVIRIVVEGMEASGEPFRLLVMPDHPTPVRCRTHVSDPVPYLLYDSRKKDGQGLLYSEANGKKSGVFVADGYTMIDKLFEDK